MMLNPNTTILFQGDSITDCDRDRSDPASLGYGYPARVAAACMALFPAFGLTFLNRGISGDRTAEVLARYSADVAQPAPDVISILLGINDVWRRYDSNDPTTLSAFEHNYRTLLQNIRRDLPAAKILLLEPFVLNALPDRAAWREDLDPKIQAVRTLAAEYGTEFVPLDGAFARAVAGGTPPAALAEDGVHPTAAGHALIAREWMRAAGLL